MQPITTLWSSGIKLRSCQGNPSHLSILVCTGVNRYSGEATLYITENTGQYWMAVASNVHETLWVTDDALLLVHRPNVSAPDQPYHYRISRYSVASRTLLPVLEHAWNV